MVGVSPWDPREQLGCKASSEPTRVSQYLCDVAEEPQGCKGGGAQGRSDCSGPSRSPHILPKSSHTFPIRQSSRPAWASRPAGTRFGGGQECWGPPRPSISIPSLPCPSIAASSRPAAPPPTTKGRCGAPFRIAAAPPLPAHAQSSCPQHRSRRRRSHQRSWCWTWICSAPTRAETRPWCGTCSASASRTPRWWMSWCEWTAPGGGVRGWGGGSLWAGGPEGLSSSCHTRACLPVPVPFPPSLVGPQAMGRPHHRPSSEWGIS